MYVFQIYTTLQEDMVSDRIEIWYLAPLILFAFVFVYGIRMRIFDRIHNIDFSELKRGTLKGEIKKENKKEYPYEASYLPSLAREDEEEFEDDGDNEPLYMG